VKALLSESIGVRWVTCGNSLSGVPPTRRVGESGEEAPGGPVRQLAEQLVVLGIRTVASRARDSVVVGLDLAAKRLRAVWRGSFATAIRKKAAARAPPGYDPARLHALCTAGAALRSRRTRGPHGLAIVVDNARFKRLRERLRAIAGIARTAPERSAGHVELERDSARRSAFKPSAVRGVCSRLASAQTTRPKLVRSLNLPSRFVEPETGRFRNAGELSPEKGAVPLTMWTATRISISPQKRSSSLASANADADRARSESSDRCGSFLYAAPNAARSSDPRRPGGPQLQCPRSLE